MICTAGLNTPLACLALMLRLQGLPVRLYCPAKTGKPSYDHAFTYRLLKDDLGMDVLPLENMELTAAEHLVLGWSHWLPLRAQDLARIRSRLSPDTEITLAYDSAFGSYLSRLRAQIRDVAKHPWLWSHLRRVVFCGDPKRLDLFGAFRRSVNFMPSPSTDFLLMALRDQNGFPAPSKGARPHRFYFAGAGHKIRRSIVEACRGLWAETDRLLVDSRQANVDYVETLQSANFCLCMPGGLVWSHRMTEAVLTGCIPILGRSAYAFIAGIVPVDAVILVKEDHNPSSWRAAVLHAANLGPHETGAKRSRLLELRENNGPLSPGNQVNTWLSAFGFA